MEESGQQEAGENAGATFWRENREGGNGSMICNWNKYMRSYNGNHRNVLNIAEWNGGSSYLSQSNRGKEKLENIKHIIKTYDIDILGIPEANILKALWKQNYR